MRHRARKQSKREKKIVWKGEGERENRKKERKRDGGRTKERDVK